MNDSSRMCRLCMDSGKPAEASMEDANFVVKLSTVSRIVFEDNKQLPSGVCSDCVQKIDQFFAFMETVRGNQEQLNVLFPSVEIKNEIFLEPQYEILEYEVKIEARSPKLDASEEVETLDSQTMENTDHENTSSPLQAENKPARMKEDHLIKEFFSLKCETCAESFETFNLLKRHNKQIHKKPTVLQCCNKSFSIKHQIIFHINHHLKPCKCSDCGKCFRNRHTLKAHFVDKHMSNDQKSFKCGKCERSFLTESLLRNHLRRHNQIDCQICQKSLSNVFSLKTHMETIHSDERKFICEICGKDFKSYKTMSHHRIIHKKLKREDGARCDICHKWINQKRYLRKHVQETHQSGEVTCDICHKVYPNVKCLTTHKGRVHVDEKFECEICGKRFKRNIYLKEHRASHTGQKLYSCEFCGMEMNSNANLSSHKKNKHPEEWTKTRQKAFEFTDKNDKL